MHSVSNQKAETKSSAEHGEGWADYRLHNRETLKGMVGGAQHVLLQALKFTVGNLVQSALPTEI